MIDELVVTAWSRDGTRLARADAAGVVTVSRATGDPRPHRRNVGVPVRCLAFDGSGARLAAAAGEHDTIVVMRTDAAELTPLWHARHGTVHFSGSGDPFGFPDEEREALALALAWRADGALACVGEGSDVTVWDAATGAPIETHEVDGWTQTTAVAASAHGWIVTGDARGGVRRFVAGTRTPLDQAALGTPVAAIAIGPPHRITITGTDQSRRILAIVDDRLLASP